MSLPVYFDEIYLYLNNFINNIKETNNARKIQISGYIMLESSKHVDKEREVYPRTTIIIANFGGSAKQSIEILYYIISLHVMSKCV